MAVRRGRAIRKRRKAKVMGGISSSPSLSAVKDEPHRKTTNESVRTVTNFMLYSFLLCLLKVS